MNKNKLINYILIGIFITVLWIPSISYFFVKDSIKNVNLEKRDFAKKPKFSIKNITNFSKDFDAYYNDHLPYRNYIVNNWRNLHYKLFDESLDNRVVIGKNKDNEPYLFYANVKSGDEISFIDGRKKIDQKELETSLNKINEQTYKLKNRQIDIYYLICPNKSTIYSEYLPKSINVHDDYFKQVYDYLKANNVSNIYYPLDLLKEASKEHETYYRTDTHWNNYGSYVYARYIINGIYNNEILKADSIDEKYINSFGHDLHNYTGISIKIKDNDIKLTYPNSNIKPRRYQEDTNNGFVAIFENDNYLIDETVLLIGDSFTTSITKYFTATYRKVLKVPFNMTEYDPIILDRYQPSKIFYLRVERSTPDSLNFEFTN